MSSLSTTTSSSITSSSIISSSSANYSSTPLTGPSLSHRRERNLSIDTTRVVVDDVFTSTINGANSSASTSAHSCPLPSPQSLHRLPSLGDQDLIQMLRSIQSSPTSSGLSTYGNSASIALTNAAPESSPQENYQPSPTTNSDSKDSSSTISEEDIIVIV